MEILLNRPYTYKESILLAIITKITIPDIQMLAHQFSIYTWQFYALSKICIEGTLMTFERGLPSSWGVSVLGKKTESVLWRLVAEEQLLFWLDGPRETVAASLVCTLVWETVSLHELLLRSLLFGTWSPVPLLLHNTLRKSCSFIMQVTFYS